MKIFKKLTKGAIFAGILVAFKFVRTILKGFLAILSRIIIFLGLEFPLFYLFGCSILIAFNCISIRSTDITSLLFYIGLMLSIICMLAVIIRNFIYNPTKFIAIFTRKQKQDDSSNTDKLIDEEKEPIHYPLCYRSNKNEKIIIFEYADHYEVFEDTPNGITQIDTLPKKLSKFD